VLKEEIACFLPAKVNVATLKHPPGQPDAKALGAAWERDAYAKLYEHFPPHQIWSGRGRQPN